MPSIRSYAEEHGLSYRQSRKLLTGKVYEHETAGTAYAVRRRNRERAHFQDGLTFIERCVPAFAGMDRESMTREVRKMFRERNMAFPQLGANVARIPIEHVNAWGTTYSQLGPRQLSYDSLLRQFHFFAWIYEVGDRAILERYEGYIARLGEAMREHERQRAEVPAQP